MKILLLTPGTGNFHCGSCLHDEALVRTLRSLGHDASINALYLPLVLDHRDGIDGDNVQMGGINLYLHAKSRLARWMPKSIETWLDRPALLRKVSDRADMTSPNELGRMTEQMLLGTHGKTRHEVDRLIEHLSLIDTPQIVLLNNALLLGLAEPIKAALGCKVACTLHGEDTFVQSLPEPWRGRVWQHMTDTAKHVDRFLPVSAYHRDVMAKRLSIPNDKLTVVHNGIEIDRYAAQNHAPDPPTIGYLARLCESKGLGTLVDAVILMHRRGDLGDARLLLVGAATPRDLRYAQTQLDKLDAAGLSERVTMQTNVSFEDKVAALRSMSMLSVPASYGESFGLYVLEANAVGVPVVEPDHAGLSEVIGLTGGGILCRPGDPASLADRLAELLLDPPLRESLGRAGRHSVRARFSAEHMARSVASALEPLCPAPTA